MDFKGLIGLKDGLRDAPPGGFEIAGFDARFESRHQG